MFVVMLFALTGCVEDVSKDKVVAEVKEARTEAPKPAAGKAWQVIPAESKIHALGAKVTATHPIDFHGFTGSVSVDGDTVTSIEFTIDMATLESDHPKLTTHLKDPDFFDVEKHPEATFFTTKVTPGGEGGTHTVTGNLTIRGMTKEVTFPATISLAGDQVEAKTEFAIDRKDFGVVYPGRKNDLIQDKVVLTIEFKAKKPS